MIRVEVPRPENVKGLDLHMFDETAKEVAKMNKHSRLYANEYQQHAMRTAGNHRGIDLLINGMMGLAGESGECIDLLKKHIFQGHPLDEERIAGELGDVVWYLAIAAEAIGKTLEEIMWGNIEKLRARYPEGFDPEKSLHRKEGDV